MALPPHASVYSIGPGPFPHPRPHLQRLPHTDLSEPRGSQLRLPGKQGKCPVVRSGWQPVAFSLPLIMSMEKPHENWRRDPWRWAERRKLGSGGCRVQAWPLTSQRVDLGAICHVCAPARSVVMALLGVQSEHSTGPWLRSYWAGDGGRSHLILPWGSVCDVWEGAAARLCLTFTFFAAPGVDHIDPSQ